jgi:signal transduction histidine kinase
VSLRLLLLAAFAYVLLLAILALEVPLALNVSDRINAEVKAQAASEAQLVAASASGRQGTALDTIVRTAARQLGGRVIVVDERGALVADSAGPGLVGRSYADRPEIRQALATDRTAQGRRQSDTLDQEVLYTAAPIVGPDLGAVRITQSVKPIDDRVRQDVLGLAAVGLAALAFGLLFAWVLANVLSRPLRGLAAAARRVEAGDLDARAEPGGASEQREVAEAFNDMTERLSRVLEAQREFVANASHQLRTPLTGLRLRIEAAGLKAGEEAAVFERFARGSAGKGVSGSGLGLPIVATLARRWGGSASLRNGESGGAEARIELRAAEEPVLPTLNRELDRALPGRG